MKILCQQEELAKFLQITSRALATKTTLPILTGILIESKDDHLRCVATDLEISIEVKIPKVQILKPGSLVLPGKTFVEIVRHLPPSVITIEVDETVHMINISSSRSSYQLPLLPVEEFPALPEMKEAGHVLVSGEKIREAVKQTTYATLAEDPRPFLSSVLWEIDTEKLRLVATDINRLAIKDLTLESAIQKNALIPVRALREIANIFGANSEEKLAIEIDEKMLFVKGAGIVFSSRLVEAQFPRYEQVIPKDFSGVLAIKRSEFIEALERTALVSFSVKMAISDGQMIVTAKEPDKGRSYEEIPIELTGPPIEIGFNARFLLDFLKSVDSEQVFFKYTQEQKPALLQGIDQEDYRYVVMPLKLTV
jgi:DNA polymerase-3 subunit beta